MTRVIQLIDGSQVTPDQFRAQNPRVQFGGEFPSVAYLETIGAAIVTLPKYPDLATGQTARLQELADLRWQQEGSGTTMGGNPLATDRTTQAKLTAAYVKASADPAYTIADWKSGPGVFAPLDATTIIAAADAVETHVQACFTNEATLSASILAATDMAALEAVDITTGWP